jgi:hypothetical protein
MKNQAAPIIISHRKIARIECRMINTIINSLYALANAVKGLKPSSNPMLSLLMSAILAKVQRAGLSLESRIDQSRS